MSAELIVTDNCLELVEVGQPGPIGPADSGTAVVRQSTSATVVNLNPDDQDTNRLILAVGTTWQFSIHGLAKEPATGDAKAWILEGLISRDGANNTALVGSVTSTVVAEDAGATAWTLVASADDTLEALQIAATGEAAHTINWLARVRVLEL